MPFISIHFHICHKTLERNIWKYIVVLPLITFPLFLTDESTDRKKHFLFNHKRAIQYSLNRFICQHPLKRTYHFQHHEEGCNWVLLQRGKRRQKEYWELKGACWSRLSTASFKTFGERWSDFQTLKGQEDYLVNRHTRLFLFFIFLLYIFVKTISSQL